MLTGSENRFGEPVVMRPSSESVRLFVGDPMYSRDYNAPGIPPGQLATEETPGGITISAPKIMGSQ